MSKPSILDQLDFGDMLDTGSRSDFLFKPENLQTDSEDNDNETVDNADDDTDDSSGGEKPDGFKNKVETFDPAELLKHNNASDEEDSEEDNNKSPEKPVKIPPQNPTKDSSSSSFPFVLVFKQLSEEGALDLDDDEFQKDLQENGATEAVMNVWRKQSQKVVDETINDLEDDVKVYLQMRENGVDAVVAGKIALDINKYSSVKEDDLEGEDNLDKRKEILEQYYKVVMPKASKEDIEELIDDKIATGKDEKEAKKGVKFLNEHALELKKYEEDRVKNESIQRQNQIKERTEKFKSFVEKNDEFIKDVKVNKQTKQKMIDAVIKPYKEFNGMLLNKVDYYRTTKPEEYNALVSYMIETGALDGKWDKPIKAAKTETIKELSAALESTSKAPKSGKANTSYKDEESSKDDGGFNDIFSEFRKKKKT